MVRRCIAPHPQNGPVLMNARNVKDSARTVSCAACYHRHALPTITGAYPNSILASPSGACRHYPHTHLTIPVPSSALFYTPAPLPLAACYLCHTTPHTRRAAGRRFHNWPAATSYRHGCVCFRLAAYARASAWRAYTLTPRRHLPVPSRASCFSYSEQRMKAVPLCLISPVPLLPSRLSKWGAYYAVSMTRHTKTEEGPAPAVVTVSFRAAAACL